MSTCVFSLHTGVYFQIRSFVCFVVFRLQTAQQQPDMSHAGRREQKWGFYAPTDCFMSYICCVSKWITSDAASETPHVPTGRRV